MTLIKTQQQQNVAMFSKIMDTLKKNIGGNNESELDTNIDDPDFSMNEFPLSEHSKLIRLNELCAEKTTVRNILV